MSHFKSIFIPLAFSCTALTLSGCGGGGSSDTATTTDDSQTANKITAENAEYYAAAAFASVDAAQRSPVTFGNPSSAIGSNSSGTFDYTDFALDELQTQNALQGTTGAVAGKPLSCQVQIVGDISDELNLVVGDNLSFDFNACTYDTDLVISNGISVEVTHVVGEFFGSPPYEIGLATSLDNLTASQDGGTEFVTSGVTNTLLTSDNIGEFNISVSGDALVVDIGSGIMSYALNLNDYSVDIMNNSANDYSISLQGSVGMDIPFVDISASYDTTTPFTGNANVYNGNPTAGVLHMTGPDNTSQMWVTAQPDGQNVEIAIDLFGDGRADTTVMTTWDELENLIPLDLSL